MIAYIKGTLESIMDMAIIVDNGGIGYHISVTNAAIARLPRLGEPVKLYTYHQVKEDGMALFGFTSKDELAIFRRLLDVSGIGPKIALSILAHMTPEQIVLAIITEDAVALSKAPGVGRKTAQRISLELRDKFNAHDAFETKSDDSSSAPQMATSEKQDAINALLNLGYGRSEGVKAVLEVAEDGMTVQDILRLALKKLG